MKFRILCLLSMILMTCTAQANTFEDFFKKPSYIRNYYMGLSFNRSQFGYDSYTKIGGFYIDPGTFKHLNNAFAFTLGERRENNTAFQVTYTHVNNYNLNYYAGSFNQNVDSLIAEAVFFFPVWRALEFKFIGGSGLYNIKYKTNYQTRSTNIQSIESKLTMGVKFGAGFQYNFTKQVAGNIEYIYQAPFDNAIKYISGFSVGLVYTFPY